MDEFDKIITQVCQLWAAQKSKSNKAEKLIRECEKIERKMIGLLENAERINPTKYLQYLESFRKDSPNE